MIYKVWDERGIQKGSAEQILYRITQKKSALASEISNMTVDQYADALIDNSPYYLPQEILDELLQRSYESKYDQALTLLSYMPASSTRILSAEMENRAIIGA